MSISNLSVDPARLAYWQQKLRNEPDKFRKLYAQMAVPMSKFCPHRPHHKQQIFLHVNKLEAFYGGAAQGGKSDALLMGYLQYADQPGYTGLIIRRTYSMLNMPGSILDRARQWFRPYKGIRWVDKKSRFEFPSGAVLQFGYLQHENDVYQYDGPEYHYIGFDELTQFTEFQYTFLFGRMRKLKGVKIPLRMRSASNPGGVGHIWVKNRFIRRNHNMDVVFVPATLHDNIYADQAAYEESLSRLDAVTRAQRRDGNWDINQDGQVFKRHWFQQFQDTTSVDVTRVRFWDLAASENSGDYTAGVRLGIAQNGTVYVEDVIRVQKGPQGVKDLVRSTAQRDGRSCMVRIEQEGGASGKLVTNDFVRYLKGFDVRGVVPTGKKHVRWRPFAAQAEANNVIVLNGNWNHDWLEEMVAVSPNEKDYVHDDQADATAGAYNELVSKNVSGFGVSFIK